MNTATQTAPNPSLTPEEKKAKLDQLIIEPAPAGNKFYRLHKP